MKNEEEIREKLKEAQDRYNVCNDNATIERFWTVETTLRWVLGEGVDPFKDYAGLLPKKEEK